MFNIINDVYEYNKKFGNAYCIENIQPADFEQLYKNCNLQWLSPKMQFAVLNYFINMVVYKIAEDGENFRVQETLNEIELMYQGNTFNVLLEASDFRYLPEKYLDMLRQSMTVYNMAYKYKVAITEDRHRSEITAAYEVLDSIAECRADLLDIDSPYYDREFVFNRAEELISNVAAECKLIDGSDLKWSPRMCADGDVLNVKFECHINIIED